MIRGRSSKDLLRKILKRMLKKTDAQTKILKRTDAEEEAAQEGCSRRYSEEDAKDPRGATYPRQSRAITREFT